MVKNLPVIAGDARDAGSIPGSGRTPGVGNGTKERSPWSVSHKESDLTEHIRS